MNLNNQVDEKKDKETVEETSVQTNEKASVVEEESTTTEIDAKKNEEDLTEEVTQEVTEEEPKKEVLEKSEEQKEEPTENQQPEKKEETPKTEEVQDSELAQYEATFKDYKDGEIIEGMIVGISENEVLVDISYKSEGSIPISEFSGSETPKKFTHIKVYIEKRETSEGKPLLSKKKADFFLALDKMREIHKTGEKINGVIKKRVKGGMIVDIMGIDAFLPGSQISTKPVPNLDHFIGKEVALNIINLDEEKKNIIVSRRKVMEEEQKEKITKLLDKIEVGAELDGEVKNITDYGAFIDLGGMDGLLHITDMSWGQINHPSEMLNISDKVKVKVIDYNSEEERISLGLKQLVPHPWENIAAKYEEGSKVTAKVVNLVPYGAFVELEPGVEGLVHISEMSWTKKVSNPKQLLNIGETLDAIVLSVSKEDKKISLGIKQMEPNPWLTIDERYPEGTVISGKVKSLTPFGAFIEIEKEIDGLVHISDISWTRRVSHPKDILKKGQEVEAIILSIDKHLHRIAMGMKQLTPDPWQNIEEKLPVNTEVEGTIASTIPKGVIVQIDVDGELIEGFVPISHLAIPRLEKPDLAFSKGDIIPMKVIELDMENRRLIFSVKAYLFSKDREALQEFLTKYEPSLNKQKKVAETSDKDNTENREEETVDEVANKTDEENTAKLTIDDQNTEAEALAAEPQEHSEIREDSEENRDEKELQS